MWLQPIASSSTSMSVSSSSNDDDDSNTIIVSDDEEYLLLELTRRVTIKNIVNATKYTARGGANLIYSIGQIVSLTIPPKNRLLVEASRLLCRVLKIIKGAYTLLSLHSQLKGLH